MKSKKKNRIKHRKKSTRRSRHTRRKYLYNMRGGVATFIERDDNVNIVTDLEKFNENIVSLDLYKNDHSDKDTFHIAYYKNTNKKKNRQNIFFPINQYILEKMPYRNISRFHFTNDIGERLVISFRNDIYHNSNLFQLLAQRQDINNNGSIYLNLDEIKKT